MVCVLRTSAIVCPRPIIPVGSIDDGLFAFLEFRIRSPRVPRRTCVAAFPIDFMARVSYPHRIMSSCIVACFIVADVLLAFIGGPPMVDILIGCILFHCLRPLDIVFSLYDRRFLSPVMSQVVGPRGVPPVVVTSLRSSIRPCAPPASANILIFNLVV